MNSPTTQTPQIGGKGVLGKPLIEKLKLVFVFICLGAIIWFSHPTLPYFIAGLVLAVMAFRELRLQRVAAERIKQENEGFV